MYPFATKAAEAATKQKPERAAGLYLFRKQQSRQEARRQQSSRRGKCNESRKGVFRAFYGFSDTKVLQSIRKGKEGAKKRQKEHIREGSQKRRRL